MNYVKKAPFFRKIIVKKLCFYYFNCIFVPLFDKTYETLKTRLHI